MFFDGPCPLTARFHLGGWVRRGSSVLFRRRCLSAGRGRPQRAARRGRGEEHFMARTFRAPGRVLAVLLPLLFLGMFTPAAHAADAVVIDPKGKIDNGDTAWMLTSSALVLMMTGPGLALFYSGLVRKKNVLATMMQSFALMALISVLWAVFGYSLAFGSGNSFIGDLHNIFLRGVGLQSDPA